MKTFFLWLALMCAALPVWAGAAQPGKVIPLSTVAVMDFDDRTVAALTSLTHLDFLKRTLSEAVLTALFEVPDIKVVERIQLKEILAEQKLGSSELADEDAKLRLGRMLGAQRMVFGSFMAIGDQIRIDLRAVDVATSLVVYADECTSDYQAIPVEVQAMSARLSKSLGGRPMQALKGQSTALWVEYDQALALSDAGHYAEAVEVLKSVLSKDKDFSAAERQLVRMLEKISRQ